MNFEHPIRDIFPLIFVLAVAAKSSATKFILLIREPMDAIARAFCPDLHDCEGHGRIRKGTSRLAFAIARGYRNNDFVAQRSPPSRSTVATIAMKVLPSLLI